VSRPRLSQALVLRVDAVSNALLAAFLLAATWDALYEFFGLPLAEPPIYAQLLGAALVAFAIVEWALAGTTAERAVTFAAAVGNALAAAVIAVWLLAADTDLDTHGQVALWSVAAFLAAAAVVHSVVLSRGRGS
jgi:predicted alpha/beta-hydrolase family hydrolase